MAAKKVRSVSQDLYPPDEAAEMETRAQLLSGLTDWPGPAYAPCCARRSAPEIEAGCLA